MLPATKNRQEGRMKGNELLFNTLFVFRKPDMKQTRVPCVSFIWYLVFNLENFWLRC
jgi:hypothetical protein